MPLSPRALTVLLCLLPLVALRGQEGFPEDPPSSGGETPEEFVARREAEIADDDIFAHLELADLAVCTGLDEVRDRHARRVLELDPDNRLAHEFLGHTYYKRKWLDPAEAEEAGLQEFHGEWLPPRVHAEHVARSEWENAWEIDNKQILLRTNTSHRKLLKYYETFMQFKKDMEATFGLKLNDKYKVNIYATKDQYHSIGQGPFGTGGYYSPGGRDFHFFDDPDFFQARRIFFHEGTHMFVNLTNRNKAFSYPGWLSEGMAEYFGASRYDYRENCYTFGHILNDRLERIQGMVNTDTYIRLSRFIRQESTRGGYDQGWSLVLFLQQRDDGTWARKFGHFLKLLRESRNKMRTDGTRGEETLEFFKRLFLRKGQTLDEFEQEWLEFVKSLQPEPGAPDFRTMKSFD